MTLISMVLLVALGAYLFKRRAPRADEGEETSPPREEASLLKQIKGFLSFKIVEDNGDGADQPRSSSNHPTRAPGSSPADRIYDTPPATLKPKDGYGIELDSRLTEDERVEEIVGLQELWDSSSHDPEKEEKSS